MRAPGLQLVYWPISRDYAVSPNFPRYALAACLPMLPPFVRDAAETCRRPLSVPTHKQAAFRRVVVLFLVCLRGSDTVSGFTQRRLRIKRRFSLGVLVGVGVLKREHRGCSVSTFFFVICYNNFLCAIKHYCQQTNQAPMTPSDPVSQFLLCDSEKLVTYCPAHASRFCDLISF